MLPVLQGSMWPCLPARACHAAEDHLPIHKAALTEIRASCSMLQVHAFCSALICLEAVTLFQVQQYVLLNLPRLPLLAEGGDQRVVARTLARLRSYLKALSAGDVEAPEPVPEPDHRQVMHRVRGRKYLLAKSTFGEDHRQVTTSFLHPGLLSLCSSPQTLGHGLVLVLSQGLHWKPLLQASIAIIPSCTRI